MPDNALLADAVLLAHAGVVLFIVLGLPVVVLGNHFGWHWVNDRRLRSVHLGAIAFVALESWLGYACPLTVLEARLRGGGGEAGCIETWVGRLIYYDAPAWVFVAAYTGFAATCALAWWRFPPHRRQ